MEAPMVTIQKELPFENEIRRYEQQDKEFFPPRGGVLFIGSSSIRMWRSLEEDMEGIPVVNRGFGGATSSQILYYIDRIVLPYKPSVIVYYFGDNDAAAGRQPEKILSNYREFICRVRDSLPSTKIIMLSIKPSLKRQNKLSVQRAVNEGMKKLSEEYQKVEYLDISTAMMLNDSIIRDDIFLPDSIHMNQKGYAIWTKILKDELAPVQAPNNVGKKIIEWKIGCFFY